VPKSPPSRWPFLRAFSQWTIADLGGDAIAALTLTAIAIPEQMATARLGSFPPETGFWVFVAASLAFALFGATARLSAGADSTITPIFAGSLALLAPAASAHYFAYAATLALLVGILVTASGLLKFGWLADLLSVPVTAGFLLGIAVHIAVSQLPALLGLRLPHMDMFAEIQAIAAQVGALNPWSLAIGIGTFAIIFVSEKIDHRIPGAIIALALATLAVIALGLAQKGVVVLGAVQGGPPHLALPGWTIAEGETIGPLAFLIAIVVLIQTAATSRSFADRTPDVNGDFIGVGAGSLLASVAGGFPVNASPPRTAVVKETGGRSPLCNIIAAAVVAIFAVFGMATLSSVPEAALAGLLFFVAQRIVRGSVIRATFRQSKGEFALIFATAGAIIFEPIATGVGIGIVLSLLHGGWTITRTRTVEFAHIPGTTIWWPASATKNGERIAGIEVVGFPAPLFFLNARDFEHALMALVDKTKPKLVILEANAIVEIDFSAAQVLCDVVATLKKEGIAFWIARLESLRARQALDRFGVLEVIGEDHIFRSVNEAVQAWEAAQKT
jgi:MFS superfamily sulfate permease-like transporter